MAALEQVRAELVTLWDRLGPLWGVSPSAARVHGWLMTQPEPQDAEEIAAGLAMSRGAVSMACTELVEWGVITAERSAGSRRSVFRPVTDLEQVIRSIVQTRKRREWDPLLDHLREWIPRLEAERSAEAAVFRERLAGIESLVSMADSMAESFLKGGLVQKIGLKLLVASAGKKKRPTRRKS